MVKIFGRDVDGLYFRSAYYRDVSQRSAYYRDVSQSNDEEEAGYKG